MRTELIAGVVRAALEVVFCRLNFSRLGVGTTPEVAGRGALGAGVGKPPKPPKPPRPKGQSIVEIAVTVLGYLVKVYGMAVVASVVRRYARVKAH